jgi:ATP-dependent Clp protease adaptor protein ClpS
MSERERKEERKGGVRLAEREEQKTRKPPMYKVLLHNDDFTPMHWVVALLRHVFRKSEAEAERVMLQVHNNGIGVAGIYTHEIAETKCAQVLQLAAQDEHPMMCSMEPDT